MIHILFNEADIDVLKQAIALDESLEGEIIALTDDYSVGPANQLYESEGRAKRSEWFLKFYEGSEFEKKVTDKDDYDSIASVVGNLRRDENEVVWIWAAQNSRDVCGYYWTLHYLKEFTGRVNILYLNNLPFINDKGGIFYPTQLNEIPAKEFLKAKKLARPITPSEFEVDPDEWTKLTESEKEVRLLEGGKKLSLHDASYLDNELKKFVTAEWQKVSKVMNQFQSKSKSAVRDAFLLWRLKSMGESVFELQGKSGFSKDLEVKLKGE